MAGCPPFLWPNNIPLCIYTPHLFYPFICWWALRLFPRFGYCEWCCSKHRSAYISSKSHFCCLWVYTQKWNCWIVWQIYFYFFEEPPYCFPQWSDQLTLPPTSCEGSLFSTPSPALLSLFFLRTVILTGVRWQVIVGLFCISLMISLAEHLFMWLLAILVSSLEKKICLVLL